MMIGIRSLLVVLLSGLFVLGVNSASAQVLNFEGICAPPNFCPVGNTYAASGITFNPNTVDVYPGLSAGDPGSWGIEGTNGTYFLGFNAVSGYVMQMNLSRNATFISLDVTRSNGSVDGNFTLTLYNGATQVFTTTVPLGPINNWKSVTASVAGGFNIITWSGTGTAFHPYAVDNIHIAGNCNGFSDVQPTDSFCSAAEWLANRGVTIGCAAGMYCPANNVTRAQMALFMRRLGDALSPVFLNAAAVNSGLDPSGQVICQTADYTNAAPKVAVSQSTINLFNPPATGLYRIYAVYSTNDGASWSGMSPAGYPSYTSPSPGQGGSASQTSIPLPLTPGASYRFGIKIDRYSGSAGGLGEAQCQLEVRIDNQPNTTSAPFDAPAVPVTRTGGPSDPD